MALFLSSHVVCYDSFLVYLLFLTQDFGDGGAFPEIHVAQFPLEMGRQKKTSNALAVQVDAEGKIKYDAIAKQGQNKEKVRVQAFNCWNKHS